MTGPDIDHDYYRLLGVPRDASTAEIRRAYRRLARQHHPDRNPHPDSPDRFRTLTDAYAALNDPIRRARYDERTRPAHARSSQPPLRHGTLELSAREALLAAAAPLTLAGPHGISIVLPAGTRDGDRVVTRIGNETVVLTIRVPRWQKT